MPDPGYRMPDRTLFYIHAESGIWYPASGIGYPASSGYSGNGRPFVSGANQIRIIPTT